MQRHLENCFHGTRVSHPGLGNILPLLLFSVAATLEMRPLCGVSLPFGRGNYICVQPRGCDVPSMSQPCLLSWPLHTAQRCPAACQVQSCDHPSSLSPPSPGFSLPSPLLAPPPASPHPPPPPAPTPQHGFCPCLLFRCHLYSLLYSSALAWALYASGQRGEALLAPSHLLRFLGHPAHTFCRPRLNPDLAWPGFLQCPSVGAAGARSRLFQFGTHSSMFWCNSTFPPHFLSRPPRSGQTSLLTVLPSPGPTQLPCRECLPTFPVSYPTCLSRLAVST